MLGDTPATPRCARAARAGPWRCPCRWNTSDAWDGTFRPPATSALQERLRLGSPSPSRPAQSLPPLAAMGTRVWGGGAPKSRPTASLPRGAGEGSSPGRDCTPLSRTQTVKSGKSQRERGAGGSEAGQGSSVGNGSRFVGWELHCTCLGITWASLAPALCQLPRPGTVPTAHAVFQGGSVALVGTDSPGAVTRRVPTAPTCEHPPAGTEGTECPWQQVGATPGRGPSQGRASLPIFSPLRMNPR